VDGDGYVSQEDYRLARKYDVNRSGTLEPNEVENGKREILSRFFSKNEGNLRVFGPSFAKRSVDENVEEMMKSAAFTEDLNKLNQVDTKLRNYTSERVVDAIAVNAPELTKHNFFVDKSDTTAWNDFDAIPRSQSVYGLGNHAGSRKRLMFIRKEEERCSATTIMRDAEEEPPFSTKRIALITNVAMENS